MNFELRGNEDWDIATNDSGQFFFNLYKEIEYKEYEKEQLWLFHEEIDEFEKEY